MEKLEDTILNNLIHNETFCRKALPHIKPDYFTGVDRVVYELIVSFIGKYNKLPTSQILNIEYQKSDRANAANAHDVLSLIDSFANHVDAELEWLVNITEKWCKDRAVHNGVMEAISIIDGKSDKAEGAIPDILNKALSVTFDTTVGHDFIDDADKRFDFYHLVEDKMPFDLEMFNTITGGGVPNKTLNILLAGCVHPNTKVKIRIRKPN